MKTQLIIKHVMKSSFVVTYAVQIVRTLSQSIFWVIKVYFDEIHEDRISKKLRNRL